MNAVVHKKHSYFLPVTIKVYSDSLVILNYGRLPDGWTIKELLEKHDSGPKNRRIAKVFYDAGRIEKWL